MELRRQETQIHRELQSLAADHANLRTEYEQFKSDCQEPGTSNDHHFFGLQADKFDFATEAQAFARFERSPSGSNLVQSGNANLLEKVELDAEDFVSHFAGSYVSALTDKILEQILGKYLDERRSQALFAECAALKTECQQAVQQHKDDERRWLVERAKLLDMVLMQKGSHGNAQIRELSEIQTSPDVTPLQREAHDLEACWVCQRQLQNARVQEQHARVEVASLRERLAQMQRSGASTFERQSAVSLSSSSSSSAIASANPDPPGLPSASPGSVPTLRMATSPVPVQFQQPSALRSSSPILRNRSPIAGNSTMPNGSHHVNLTRPALVRSTSPNAVANGTSSNVTANLQNARVTVPEVIQRPNATVGSASPSYTYKSTTFAKPR